MAYAGKSAGLKTLARQRWEAQQRQAQAEQAQRNAAAQAALVASVTR